MNKFSSAADRVWVPDVEVLLLVLDLDSMVVVRSSWS